MKPRLFLLNPVEIFRARVNMASATYPLDEIIFDTVTTGTPADVEAGMTVVLGSAADKDDRGRQRVRDIPGSTVMKVGRSSQGVLDGELNALDNSYITVLNDFRVWAKIQSFDEEGEPYKDSDIGVGDIGNSLVDHPPPKANGGIGYAGTVDPVTGLITVEFDATDSWQWDQASSSLQIGIIDFFWGIRDGTITVGTYTDGQITATFPAGFRWVHLEVTDGQGRKHIMHIPVYARNPEILDTSIGGFQITSWNEGVYGTEIDVLVLDNIHRSTYLDGTLAMLWDDEAPPDASPDRNHVLFIGWVQTEDASIEAQATGTLRNTTLHLVDVAGRLKRLPAFSQVVENAVAGNHWYWTVWPVALYYLWYLLHWHSTALELADLKTLSATLHFFEFKVLSSDAGNLFDQVNAIANHVTPDHHLTCHRKGQLMIQTDPIIRHTEDRHLNPTIQSFPNEDWVSLRYGYERSPRLFKLISWAIKSTTVMEVIDGVLTIRTWKCISPGKAPGQGLTSMETSDRIAASQTDLNIVEGHRYARMNARMGPITLETIHSKLVPGFSPAYMGWIEIPVEITPQRGDLGGRPVFSTMRTICHQVTYNFNYQRTGLVVTVTLTLEAETSGPPAITLDLDEEV